MKQNLKLTIATLVYFLSSPIAHGSGSELSNPYSDTKLCIEVIDVENQVRAVQVWPRKSFYLPDDARIVRIGTQEGHETIYLSFSASSLHGSHDLVFEEYWTIGQARRGTMPTPDPLGGNHILTPAQIDSVTARDDLSNYPCYERPSN